VNEETLQKNERRTKEDEGPSSEDLLYIYKTMLLARVLDKKILSIQRQGRIGPYVPCMGEEGAVVPSTFLLSKEDWLFTSYRELGAHLARGLSLDLILAQLFGNSGDLSKGRQMSNSWQSKELNDVPTAAPIGAYLPVAVGVATAMKLLQKKKKGDGVDACVLAFLGDGATSSSDFHVAMNFAGVYKAPIVFLVRNNGWAISLPVSKQTGSESLAVKARAYGFEGTRVDGSNVREVYSKVKQTLNKARDGGGPTLIEALTYRAGPHSTADDPKRYRTDVDDESLWDAKDPILLLKRELIASQLWGEERDLALVEEYEKLVSESIARQEGLSPLPVDQLFFEDVYFTRPWNLQEQSKEL
jgi:pyruvate dehydrogenase E1 component alpha subunit